MIVPLRFGEEIQEMLRRGDDQLTSPFSPNPQPERLGFTDSSRSQMPVASRSGSFRFPTFVRDNAVR